MERGRIGSVYSSSSLPGGVVQTPQNQPSMQASLGTRTQLRPLPGYSLPNLKGVGGEASQSGGATAAASATTSAANMDTAAPPTTVRRYKTREHLYYEAEATADPTGKSSTMAAGFSAVGGDTDRPFSLLDRLAEDAPPATSLRDIGTLTPERKYSSQEDVRGPDGSPVNKFGAGSMASVTEEEPVMASEGNWVTVFGFATSQMNAVLEYFQRLGVVEAREAGQGNWFHLKYSTQWAAQKALAKNGSVLVSAGSCMIGVIPTQRAMDQVSQASDSFMSPLKREVFRPTAGTSATTGPSDIFLRSGILSPRPPTAADSREGGGEREADFGYVGNGGDGERLPAAVSVAPSALSHDASRQRPTSMISQALGYVLGW